MAAANVFGTPVTEGSRVERATRAFNLPNEGNKQNQAIAYVRRQKENFGNGVSTLCIFYNATGDTMLYEGENSSYGAVFGVYPVRVQNGHWGAYLHAKNRAFSGSVAFVVYNVRNTDDVYIRPVLAWQTPWGRVRFNNQVYSDVFLEPSLIRPNDVYKAMDHRDSRQHSVRKLGMFITSTIGEGTSPMYEARLTIGAVAAKKTSEEVEASSSELVVEDESKKAIEDASEKTSKDVEDASKKTCEDAEA